MFIETLKTLRLYERQSKLGVYHTFKRKNTMYVFRCDSCSVTYLKPRIKVNVDHASNNFKHQCAYCSGQKTHKKVKLKKLTAKELKK